MTNFSTGLGFSDNIEISPIHIDIPKPRTPCLSTERFFGYTLIALGVIAVLTEILIISLSYGSILPHSGILGSALGLGSIRTLILTSSGLGALAMGSLLLYLHGGRFEREFRKRKEAFKKEMISKNGEGCVFKATDRPAAMLRYESDKPRILLLSSHAGGGHKTAACATKQALENAGYSVITIYPTEEIPGSGLWNKYQKSGNIIPMKLLTKAQPLGERLSYVKQNVEDAIDLYKPQFIISVQPISNKATATLAHSYRIPFCIIPTDYSYEHFFHNFKGAVGKMRIALPLSDSEAQRKLADKCQFREEIFTVTGYPLRPAFQGGKTEIAQKAKLKKSMEIEENAHVILMSMGAQGGKKVLEYCEKIRQGFGNSNKKKLDHTVEIFVLCGNNNSLNEQIESLKTTFPKNVRLHPVGFIQEDSAMATYVKMADIYVTKPGGASTSEGWAVGTYLFFDGSTANATPWEPINMQTVCEKGAGEIIDNKTFAERLYQFFCQREEDTKVREAEDKRSSNIENHDYSQSPVLGLDSKETFADRITNIVRELTDYDQH